MKSLYGRQFLLTAGMILISFALLGTSFIALTYRYTIQDTRNSMERNVDDVASFTGSTQEQGIGTQSKVYQIYIANIARIANAVVIIADSDGSLVLYADGSGDAIRDGLAVDHLPQSVMQTVLESGGYSGMSSLGGLFPERRFVSGTPIVVKSVDPFTGQTQQTVVGAAYMAARTSDITELWQAFISIFFFTAVVVLCISFITSSITSLRLTNPLKEIAEATRKFGHGEYEARVRGYERRRDEVGELAEAFNAMADSIAKSEEKRSEFVANISHELKTPMTTIAGFADGILDGTIPPDKERAALQTISSETRRLSRLVRRMLDLSRLQSAESITAQEQFDLTEHASQLHFTDNFYLPVYFETYLYEECQTEEKTYSKTEAAAIAQSRFEQYLANLEEKGIQILEKNVMIEKADQKYVVTGTVDAYESIVSYQPTEILEITSEERQQPNESD